MPRKLSVAVTTAAIPAVMMSSMALAESAEAVQPEVPAKALFPQLPLQAQKNLAAGATIPAAQLATQVPATVAAESAVPATHRIVPGDTVSSIAAQYGLDVNEVLRANNLQPTSVIYAGKELQLTGTAKAPEAAAASSAYTVVPGDTLSSIAAAHNVSLESVLAANGLTMTSIIHPGQEISLDSAAAGASSSITTLATPAAPAAPAAEAPTDLVPSTFLHYTYPQHVVAGANVNKQALNSVEVPTRAQMQQLVAETALAMGVDPALAQAFAFQESGFDQRAVSPANAIGTMQVIPSSGEWASGLVGRQLNLLDPQDNVTAGVAIIRSLIRTSPSLEVAIASYYQGQYSVTTQGMYPDTEAYVANVLAHRATF
ncbi:LysM peptidoglycan-binding domain-containing protein [Arthrobacter sp. Sa2CUA1]|uniref:LysM peptidoglycan-binding domain-containing protein n=1 Tax=Arthrobacter gallicola TaxID=2762225 RepID=A0ABR8UMG8_9MICC|nr:LysM peptidoglycan-binding domain-containing protein [Arthrobacter gallicola]MBD7993749.1 LysM peptidoglycan-binding domain-containing protein [Arthrobacter gallicola]